MKLKKLLAAATSAALALTTMAIAPLTASAESFDAAPSGTETILGSMTLNSAAVPYSLDSYKSIWVQNYDSDLASWVADSDAYLKVSVSNVSDYTNDSGSTPFDDVITWDIKDWFQFMSVDSKWYFPSGSVSAASSTVYVPMTNFSLNEYNGIGFNIQAGHVGYTITAADIVKISDSGSSDPTPSGGDIAFEFPTGPISLTINDASGWGDASTTKAGQAVCPISTITGVKLGKTTAAELLKMYSTISLNGIQYKNDDLNAGADKFDLVLYVQHGSGWEWKAYSVGTLASPTASVKIADILGSYNEDDVIQTMGLQITCKGGDVPAIESMNLGDTFYLNRASTPVKPDPDPVKPDPDPVDPVGPTDGVLWSGSEDLKTDWSASVSIPAEKFADIKADDTLIFTFTKGSADYFQIKIMDGDWTPLASPKTNKWDCVELSDSPYEVKISAADASALKAKGMVVSGYGIVLKSVAVKSAGGSDEPSETVTVTISGPVNSIEVGKTAVLAATASNGAAITAWKSSDESVASVENGIITGKKAGTAVITAFCGDAYAEFTVTVTAPAVTPFVTPVVPSIWGSIFTNVPSVPGTASLSETEKAANKLKFGSDVSFIPENNTLDADLIMALLKSNNKLKANMGSYAFIFDGSKPNDLFDLTGGIDLGISYMSVPTDIMEMFPNADKIIVFRTNYSGQLPTEVILSMNAGKEFFKENASLFCIDDAVEFISSGKIKANGMVDVPGLTHFSTYAVVVGNTASSNVVYENVDSAQGIALETETASHSVLPVIAVIAASAAAVFAAAVTVKKLRNSR